VSVTHPKPLQMALISKKISKPFNFQSLCSLGQHCLLHLGRAKRVISVWVSQDRYLYYTIPWIYESCLLSILLYTLLVRPSSLLFITAVPWFPLASIIGTIVLSLLTAHLLKDPNIIIFLTYVFHGLG
jgi:hypothetical protein